LIYYPHVAESNTRMMATDNCINTLSQRMDHDFDVALYYMRIGMESGQANMATVYANNYAITQCCRDAQRMADLRARLDALMMTTNMQEAMREAMRATMPKKKLTLEELNRILFPNDPIRDWSERTLAAIEAKYAWLNDYE